MTTINLNEITLYKNLRLLHDRYPYHIICYLGDLELSDSPFLKPITNDEGDEEEAYYIENRQQLYDFIKDLSHKIYEYLDYRSLINLGTPLDDETSDIYNAIDVLKALSELEYYQG